MVRGITLLSQDKQFPERVTQWQNVTMTTEVRWS